MKTSDYCYLTKVVMFVGRAVYAFVIKGFNRRGLNRDCSSGDIFGIAARGVSEFGIGWIGLVCNDYMDTFSVQAQ